MNPTRTPLGMTIEEVQAKIRTFNRERDWSKFHSPKNLASSISIEAGELLEHFQWCTTEESEEIGRKNRDEIASEVADVAMYTLMLADRLGINVLEEMDKKISVSSKKYPVEKAKGVSTKYTKL